MAADGPFSIFPDIDRTLSLLDGDGIELVAETGSMNELQRGSEPFSFAADLGINGRLLNGPITDLNVMSRRGRFTHRVQRRVIDDTISIQPGAGTTMLIGNSPYIVLQPKAEIQPLDLVILTSSEITLRPLGRYAVIFIVELIPMRTTPREERASRSRSTMNLTSAARFTAQWAEGNTG